MSVKQRYLLYGPLAAARTTQHHVNVARVCAVQPCALPPADAVHWVLCQLTMSCWPFGGVTSCEHGEVEAALPGQTRT